MIEFPTTALSCRYMDKELHEELGYLPYLFGSLREQLDSSFYHHWSMVEGREDFREIAPGFTDMSPPGDRTTCCGFPLSPTPEFSRRCKGCDLWAISTIHASFEDPRRYVTCASCNLQKERVIIPVDAQEISCPGVLTGVQLQGGLDEDNRLVFRSDIHLCKDCFWDIQVAWYAQWVPTLLRAFRKVPYGIGMIQHHSFRVPFYWLPKPWLTSALAPIMLQGPFEIGSSGF